MASTYAVEVMAVAVMSNHLHLVVRNRPDLVQDWSLSDIADRWAVVYPKRNERGEIVEPDPKVLEAWAADPSWVATHRARLASLSWFMKSIKEPLARMANKEDGCTGAFWEGRFTAVALLDSAAIATCMAYVDLNPIRAKMAKTPEERQHTSIKARRQRHARREKVLLKNSPLRDAIIRSEGLEEATTPEAHLWLNPIAECKPIHRQDPLFTVDEYCELVDTTGRILATGKRGRIPSHLLPILDRLDIDVKAWFTAVTSMGRFLGTAVGNLQARAKEAIRRGVKWIADKAGFYPKRTKPTIQT